LIGEPLRRFGYGAAVRCERAFDVFDYLVVKWTPILGPVD
jgi:hypothetical protein